MSLGVFDRKKLWGLAAAKCSICNRDLFLKEETDISDTNIGKECHISSHKPNHPCQKFSRYDENLSEKKRDKSYDNAILLCGPHHDIIDNCENTSYTIKKLHQIKAKHEAWIGRKLKEDTSESIELNKRIKEIERKLQTHEQEMGLNRERSKWMRQRIDDVVGNIEDEKIRDEFVKIFESSTTIAFDNSLEKYGNVQEIISCPICKSNLILDASSGKMFCRKCQIIL